VDENAEEAIDKSTGEIFVFRTDTPVGLGVIACLTQEVVYYSPSYEHSE
jgi:hypothetical protein